MSMGIEDPKLAEALEQVRMALAEMGAGNPGPYIGCWADSDDATLFGAWGPIDKGFRRLAKTFRWVGTRFRRGRLVPEYSVVASSGDLAYTVDDGPPRPMTIRVTHIFRRVGDSWRLVHRHADFPPPDQRCDSR